MKIPNLLIVQRVSMSHATLKSRSISARFGTLFDYMRRKKMLKWTQIVESEISDSDIENYDIILFNKHTSCRGLEIIKVAKSKGVKTIYDIDDWILNLPSYSVTKLSGEQLSNVAEYIKSSDSVTVSNGVLKEYLSGVRPDCEIVGTGFDHELFPVTPEGYSESLKPKILLSNTDGLKLVKFRDQFISQLSEFMSANKDLTLDFFGDYLIELKDIPRLNYCEYVPNEIYKKTLSAKGYWFAIIPLGGSEDQSSLNFNNCKSSVKYIDFGSLCIPGVYSDTKVYSNVVRSGFNGVLVKNEGSSWIDAMTRMYCNSELRQSIRVNSYHDCVEKFGIENPSMQFSKLLEKLGG